MPSPDLWTVTIICVPALAETIGDALEDEALSVTTMIPPRHAMAEVQAIYGAEPEAASFSARLSLLAALHKAKTPSFKIAPVGNLDWLKKVATDFPPLPIARWVVYGAAHRKAIKNPRLALHIDATNAFGTGEHPSTRGCLIMLDRLLKKRSTRPLRTMFDVGCGSGVLSMAFAKACRGRAVGVDMDKDSVRIARENAQANGLNAYTTFRHGMGYRPVLVKQKAPYDLIMGNIFARPLCLLAKDLRQHLRFGGYAILSGILNHQANSVIAAHRMQGLHLHQRISIGEWSVLVLKRPSF